MSAMTKKHLTLILTAAAVLSTLLSYLGFHAFFEWRANDAPLWSICLVLFSISLAVLAVPAYLICKRGSAAGRKCLNIILTTLAVLCPLCLYLGILICFICFDALDSVFLGVLILLLVCGSGPLGAAATLTLLAINVKRFKNPACWPVLFLLLVLLLVNACHLLPIYQFFNFHLYLGPIFEFFGEVKFI